jgi:hypothetical protein
MSALIICNDLLERSPTPPFTRYIYYILFVFVLPYSTLFYNLWLRLLERPAMGVPHNFRIAVGWMAHNHRYPTVASRGNRPAQRYPRH